MTGVCLTDVTYRHCVLRAVVLGTGRRNRIPHRQLPWRIETSPTPVTVSFPSALSELFSLLHVPSRMRWIFGAKNSPLPDDLIP